MTRQSHKISLPREKWTQGLALALLLLIGGLAIAGPSGLLAWSENLQLLEQRQAHISKLKQERAALANQVALLNPENADPDRVGERLRRDFNVVHEDEVVLILDEE
ncbi:septum formation initiator family protein [Allopontixanthobacter sp.]|uniref:FtsB family cell division protein n=1 Tax=Allopontixanthobacter sp. TaxID=2906452 RepID=UPI002AB9F0C1|nr:septum formation initiator family protein [Allopontixanthobacter sp.]MDZ4306453.1 septum formation initiator family protein [Allopontixanthobacter sp.]